MWLYTFFALLLWLILSSWSTGSLSIHTPIYVTEIGPLSLCRPRWQFGGSGPNKRRLEEGPYNHADRNDYYFKCSLLHNPTDLSATFCVAWEQTICFVKEIFRSMKNVKKAFSDWDKAWECTPPFWATCAVCSFTFGFHSDCLAHLKDYNHILHWEMISVSVCIYSITI